MTRAFRSRFTLVLTLIAVVSLLAVACGDSETATSVPATSTSAAEPDATSTPETNRSPTADFTWDPAAVPRGDNYTTPFTFTATASDPDGDELSYDWQITGGNPGTATGRVIEVFFPGVAPYGVTLTVSDGKGGEATVTHTVPLTDAAEPGANNPPTADFTWDPAAVPRGDNYTTPFTFTATASDPDGDELSYEWQITGGNPGTATGRVVEVFFPGVAPYGVTLTVSDGKGGEAIVSHTVPLTDA